MKLDERDRLILELLRHNARISNRNLARHAGLSPSTCLMRVRRLESHGYIVAYRTIIARSGSGSLLEGWADVRLMDPDPESTSQLLRLIGATPEIVEAHRTAGHFDYGLRFCAGNFEAWSEFRQRLASLGCQSQSRFSILVEPIK